MLLEGSQSLTFVPIPSSSSSRCIHKVLFFGCCFLVLSIYMLYIVAVNAGPLLIVFRVPSLCKWQSVMTLYGVLISNMAFVLVEPFPSPNDEFQVHGIKLSATQLCVEISICSC